jgi:hypothetical protein
MRTTSTRRSVPEDGNFQYYNLFYDKLTTVTRNSEMLIALHDKNTRKIAWQRTHRLIPDMTILM